MASLADHQSNEFTKLLAIGTAKTGKTGSLVSLVKAGYKLRILDTDNLLDILKHMVLKECPEFINNIEFRTVRDKYKNGPTGVVIDGKPKAWTDALKLLNHWKYTEDNGVEVDLGVPAEWGPDCILVVDSLSRLCDAAYAFHYSMIPGDPAKYDGRAIYKNAQDDVEKQLASLTSKGFKTNLIVIAHVTYLEQPDGSTKGFPQGVGNKLSPKIPSYFPSVVLYTNKLGKRTIQTNTTPLMDLANPAPFEMAPSYPIETGLAEFFSVLRPSPTQVTKPKAVTLVRKP